MHHKLTKLRLKTLTQRGIQKIVLLKPRSSFEKYYSFDKNETHRKNSK